LIEKIKVLIIDDSALIRELLNQILSEESDIEVVGRASDAYFAVDKIKHANPDVITLDIEMPKVNGLVFLENLMKSNPLPVIMISSLTEEGSDAAIKALQLGALDFVAKPKSDISANFLNLKEEILEKIRMAAESKQSFVSRKKSIRSTMEKRVDISHQSLNKIITIGASTGGVEAITSILKQMPDNIPPIVIVQHMPEKFVPAFAKRLDGYFNFIVKVAEDNEIIEKGKVLIAPGNKHMEIVKNGSDYAIKLLDTPKVNNHRPSVDVFFDSVAENIGAKALAILLTGMGKDGALGLKRIKEAGGLTIAQSRSTCIVYGMPGEAVRIGAAEKIIDLDDIPDQISRLI
jgi:two-component system chemotaxis response regulator CheB